MKVWFRIWERGRLLREVPIVVQPGIGWAARMDGILYTSEDVGGKEVLRTMVYLYLCKGLTEAGKEELVKALDDVFAGRAQHFAAWDWDRKREKGGWDYPPQKEVEHAYEK